MLRPPPRGERVIVEVGPGMDVALPDAIFDPDQARYTVDGSDLVVTLQGDGVLVLEDFFAHPADPASQAVNGGPAVDAATPAEVAFLPEVETALRFEISDADSALLRGASAAHGGSVDDDGIQGEGGNDTLRALDGDDPVNGGAGDDRLDLGQLLPGGAYRAGVSDDADYFRLLEVDADADGAANDVQVQVDVDRRDKAFTFQAVANLTSPGGVTVGSPIEQVVATAAERPSDGATS